MIEQGLLSFAEKRRGGASFPRGRPDSEVWSGSDGLQSLFQLTNFNWRLRNCTNGGPLEALRTHTQSHNTRPFLYRNANSASPRPAWDICAARDKGISVRSPQEIPSHGGWAGEEPKDWGRGLPSVPLPKDLNINMQSNPHSTKTKSYTIGSHTN